MFNHLLPAFLFALGTLTPALGALFSAQGFPLAGFAACAAVLLLLFAGGRKKLYRHLIALFCLIVLTLLALADGAFLPGLIETCKALYLLLCGQSAVLPLFSTQIALLLGILFALLSWALTDSSLGPFPGIVAAGILLVALWEAGRWDLLIYSFPVPVALVLVRSRYTDENSSLHRVLPIAVLSVTLAFLLTPLSGLTFTPLKDAADSLRQMIYDRLFFTEARDVFSLSVEGYYPLGENRLGGPAVPKDETELLVITDSPVYLRGTSRNTYTGRVWVDTLDSRRYLYHSLRTRAERSNIFSEDYPVIKDSPLLQEHTVSVTMLSPSASTLFVPVGLTSLSVSGSMVPYFNSSSELFITRNLEQGDTWSMTAPLVTGGQAGLEELLSACARQGDKSFASIAEIYTELPGHLEPAMYELCAEILTGETNAYRAAMKIMTFLQTKCTYSLKASAPPENVDFVSYFLLNTRKGYCTYFASAMTVLCRMAGLPARYVEGYLAIPPSGQAQMVLTGENAHAWTEVYFPGFGWVVFDATPGEGQSASHAVSSPPSGEESPPPQENTPTPPPQDTPSPTPDTDPSATPEPSSEPSPSPEPGEEPPVSSPEPDSAPEGERHFPFLLLFLLLLAALIALRLWMTDPNTMARHTDDTDKQYRIWLQALLQALTMTQLRRNDTETLTAFRDRVSRAFPDEAVTNALSSLSRISYSNGSVSRKDLTSARDGAAAVFRSLSRGKKLQLILRRFLTVR